MASPRKQRGFAMILVMVVVAMGSTWMVLTRLNSATTEITIAKRAHNAKVMTRAKETLIGYVAAQANKEGENNPGNLPCPENPGDFYNSDPQYEWRQGLVGTGCGSSVKVGRFPWRTLGLEKLVDADGEALWYVVSPNWGGSSTVINSDSAGQLTVDGVANAAIALIIAPGAAISVQAATGCTAWNQTRPTNATPDWRNYVECENATSPADYAFVTTGPSGSFNDQVMVVTAAEMLPPLEAAIANRIEREIVPALKGVYASSDWGTGVSASTPAFPFAATFSDPGTANYQGSSGTYAGLLPFSYQPSGTCGSDPRCTSTFHTWGTPAFTKTSGSASLWPTQVCSTYQQTTGGTTYNRVYCYGYYYDGSIALNYDDRLSNVGKALRAFTLADYTTTLPPTIATYRWNGSSWVSTSGTTTTQSRRFNADGSFSFVLTSTLPTVSGNWGLFEYRTTRPAFSDHALLDDTDATTGWFVRNKWHQLTYYAVAQGYTGTSTPACTTGTNCLSVTSTDGARPITPTSAQRAILILAGRSMSASSRPNSTLADYLENGNATGSFIRQVVSRTTFNDRVVVVSSN